MTVLSVVADACKVIGVDVPTGLLASTDREHVELAAIAQEMAERIARGHQWQLLSRIHTITGDGTTEDWDLPSDYDRMPVKAQLWSSSLASSLTPIPDIDRWLGLDVRDNNAVLNAWTIYGGQMHIKPALSSGVTVKFFYQSDLIVAPAAGSNKTAFTLDTDTFRLDEQLFKLAVIWRWKEAKGQSYAEWLDDYEELKERLVSRDRGSHVIRIGQRRIPSGVTMAYPWALDT